MKYVIILLSLCFLGSSLYMLDGIIKQLGYLTIGGSLFLLLFAPLFLHANNFKIKIYPIDFILYYFFVMWCMLSGLANTDLVLIVSATGMVLIYISLIIILPALVNGKTPELVYKAILISHIPIIIISLIIEDFNTDRFQGLFNNSNSFGSVAATLFAMFSAILFKYVHDYIFNIEQKYHRQFIKYLLLCIFFLLLVALSSSRTSAAAVAGVILLGTFLIIVKVFLRKRIKLLYLKRLIKTTMIVVIVMCIFIWPMYEVFSETILEKFQIKIKSGDVLDQRGFIWGVTLQEASFVGYGSNYFEKFSLGPHNTYISLLGQFGWFAVIFFVLFLLVNLIKSVRYAINSNGDKYSFVPVLLLITFMLLSVGEGMMLKVSMLGSFACLGCLSKLDHNVVNNKLDLLNKSIHHIECHKVMEKG